MVNGGCYTGGVQNCTENERRPDFESTLRRPIISDTTHDLAECHVTVLRSQYAGSLSRQRVGNLTRINGRPKLQPGHKGSMTILLNFKLGYYRNMQLFGFQFHTASTVGGMAIGHTDPTAPPNPSLYTVQFLLLASLTNKL
jgi:hypothetical protein